MLACFECFLCVSSGGKFLPCYYIGSLQHSYDVGTITILVLQLELRLQGAWVSSQRHTASTQQSRVMNLGSIWCQPLLPSFASFLSCKEF